MSFLVEADLSSKNTVALARGLLGKFLVVGKPGKAYAAAITEVEAYDGPEDLACHASKGRTRRTEPLFGPSGHWYVYLCYGIHEMLNVVTGPRDYPAAILIRGISELSGPGRLTKRLGVNRRFNARPMSPETGLWIEDRGLVFANEEVDATPRIGIDFAGKDWASRPYRFLVKPDCLAARSVGGNVLARQGD